MGNSQSNERKPNYKIYKVTRVERNSGWARCYLDGYVPYSNGSYKQMDFWVRDSGAFDLLGMVVAGISLPPSAPSEGSYIAIDTNMTEEHTVSYDFHPNSVKTVGMETRDSNGNINFLEFVDGVGELISGARARERQAIMAQRERFEREIQAWHLEPPKKW